MISNLTVVSDYLKKNLPEEIKYLDESNESKDNDNSLNRISKTNNVKGINENFKDIPFINCFDLAGMVTGNTIKNIFDKGISINDNDANLENKSTLKFISYVFFDEACKLINNHLYKISKDFIVISLGNGKFLIDITYKNNVNLEIILQFFKINDTKHMFSINYKKGNRIKFYLFVKSIYENFKNIFIEF